MLSRISYSHTKNGDIHITPEDRTKLQSCGWTHRLKHIEDYVHIAKGNNELDDITRNNLEQYRKELNDIFLKHCQEIQDNKELSYSYDFASEYLESCLNHLSGEYGYY